MYGDKGESAACGIARYSEPCNGIPTRVVTIVKNKRQESAYPNQSKRSAATSAAALFAFRVTAEVNSPRHRLI